MSIGSAFKISDNAFQWGRAYTDAFSKGLNDAIAEQREYRAQAEFDARQAQQERNNERQDSQDTFNNNLRTSEEDRRATAFGERSGAPSSGAAIDPSIPPAGRALLATIGQYESGGRYDVRYSPNGGVTFRGTGDHPRVMERGPAGPSSAAGRYQFTATTWDATRAKFNQANPDDPIRDFSPRNQDRAAWFLAQQDYTRNSRGRNLQEDLTSGQFNSRHLNSTWTSIPGGVEGTRASGVAAETWQRTFRGNMQKYGREPAMSGAKAPPLAEEPLGPPAPDITPPKAAAETNPVYPNPEPDVFAPPPPPPPASQSAVPSMSRGARAAMGMDPGQYTLPASPRSVLDSFGRLVPPPVTSPLEPAKPPQFDGPDTGYDLYGEMQPPAGAVPNNYFDGGY